jgi:hypothetical protein
VEEWKNKSDMYLVVFNFFLYEIVMSIYVVHGNRNKPKNVHGNRNACVELTEK